MPKYIIVHDQQPLAQPQTPDRRLGGAGSIEHDYSLPLRHVATSGLFGCLGSTIMWAAMAVVAAILVAVPRDLLAPLLPLVLVPVALGIVAGFRVAAREWGEFTDKVKASRWLVELAAGRDLDGDGHVGRPPIIVEGAAHPTTREQRHRQELDEFRTWILSLDTGGTAYRQQAGITRREYERRRDSLIRAGKAEWVDPENHRAGWALTVPADQVAAGIK